MVLKTNMNKAVRPNQSGLKIPYMFPNDSLRCLGTSSVVVEHTDSEMILICLTSLSSASLRRLTEQCATSLRAG